MSSTWEQQTSPLVKFEDSPAESFVSTPGEMYPSLFAATSPAASSTMNPLDIMTPRSQADDAQKDVQALSALTASLNQATSPAPTPASAEKKATKKRKSWGQVLPEPKTNLPPRKRAKTEDEKEQRRVERVLRNRRAAQSSRERKRLETEALEERNKELEARLHTVERANLLLIEELNKYRQTSGVVTRSSSPLNSLRSNPVTLSQELFGHQDHKFLGDKSLMSQLAIPEASNTTVDPASLSPELAPVRDSEEPASPGPEDPESPASDDEPADLTQHPAAMLSDLQCHQSAALPRSWTASQPSPALAFHIQLQLALTAFSAILSVCQRPLTQIHMSLKKGFPLPPTPSILRTIIWLVTRPSSRISTSTTSSTSRPEASRQTPSRASRSRTLRFKSLQKILTCSPLLARPLQDATLEALRLASEGCDDRVSELGTGSWATREADGRTPPDWWPSGAPPPSREALLTLLWALRVEERRMSRPDWTGIHKAPTQTCDVVLKKRKWEPERTESYAEDENSCRL